MVWTILDKNYFTGSVDGLRGTADVAVFLFHAERLGRKKKKRTSRVKAKRICGKAAGIFEL